MMRSLRLYAGIVAALLALPAGAQEIKIGARATPTLDPHFLFLDSNIAYHYHLFGRLVDRADDGRYVPGLATSWRMVDPQRWRFELRRDVMFHDGKPFTADDVVFSFARVPSVPNNPAPYTSYLTSVGGVEKVDDHTVDIVTTVPNPLLPVQVNGITIVAKHAVEGRSTADFATGVAAIGTGPYRFVSHRQGERLVLERFDGYRGETPLWQRVEFRILANNAARTAALLAGDVDLIDNVSATDAERLNTTTGFAVHRAPMARVIYLGATISLGRSPLTTDAAGQPLEQNPLADVRVRRAISLAINRQAIVERIMGGYAAPASQIVTPGMVGFVASRQPDPFAPEESAKLLREAGWGQGFRTSLSCPGDRYPGDAATCQAIGQMLARAGILASVEVMPANVYFARLRTPGNELPLFLLGWGDITGDATATLVPVVHSYDREKRMGVNNRSGFADADLDGLIEAAVVELDNAKRVALLEQAMRLATDRYAVIPLYQPMSIFASRAGLVYRAGLGDEKTLAMRASPAPR